MRRVVIAGTVAMPAVVAGVLGAGVALQHSRDADEWARFANATEVEGLAVVVERDEARVRAGRPTTYTISVGNRGGAAEALTVRATVPPWLSPTGTPGATPGDGYVDWSLVVPPGEVVSTELTGVYAAPDAAAPRRVTLTACLLEPTAGEPVVCDTEAARLAPPRSRQSWWLAAGAATVTVATGAGAATVLYHRRRRAGVTGGPAA